MAKKMNDTTSIGFEEKIWKAADILRGNLSASQYEGVVLGLIFLKYISDRFDEKFKELQGDEYADPEDKDEYTADNIFFVPQEARWSNISAAAHTPEIGVVIDNALIAIERENERLKNILPKNFARPELDKRRLGDVVDLFTNIEMHDAGEEKDLLGRTYEYCLQQFASLEGKNGGEFYTPSCIVRTLVEILEPYEGRVYDPCCGSGGMFVQSAALVKSKQGNLNSINVYGQEKEPATYRLAKMNLALRGISHNLGSEADSSFTHDLHEGLRFNYIMANPPFNLKGWYNDNLKNDPRWADYATPPESNANYAWILHILSHLKADGVAGFLLANGALNDSDTSDIRRKLIENDKVEAIIVLPRELFITTDISVTLWILNRNKKGGNYHGRNLRNREHEILFMDLRQWRENPVKGEQKKKIKLVTKQIEKAAEIYHTWQNEGTVSEEYAVPELYRSVKVYDSQLTDEELKNNVPTIESKGYTLTPSKYIEFIDHDLEIDYEKEMARVQAEMQEIMKQEKESQQMLEDAFRGIGYGIE